ncbi:hypothetical protein SEPCBS119000_003461 [Sporothrix epigloea]|uniref:Uncharacterized protein n=1 Tax=Sporothrix epigloea TaxID=1892477 RepID=A0ABP0DLU3_9PEZI
MSPALPPEWELPRMRYSLNFEDADRNTDDAYADTGKLHLWVPAQASRVAVRRQLTGLARIL